MTAYVPGETVVIRDQDLLVRGTVLRVIAGRLLVVLLPDGRKIRRRAL